MQAHFDCVDLQEADALYLKLDRLRHIIDPNALDMIDLVPMRDCFRVEIESPSPGRFAAYERTHHDFFLSWNGLKNATEKTS